MRLRRDGKGRGRHLEWRVRILGVGAVLALAGMWAGEEWLVNLAIAVLVGGFLLRFVDERDGAEGEEDEGAS